MELHTCIVDVYDTCIDTGLEMVLNEIRSDRKKHNGRQADILNFRYFGLGH